VKKRFFLFYMVTLFCTTTNAQLGKEAWHWEFGCGSSLDFSSGFPISGSSNIFCQEGCASISDKNTGQLLFYTDGSTIWNRNNIQMPNGYGMLGGYGTSTQAALIIPKPCSNTVYYLISADQGGYAINNLGGNAIPNLGIHYSIVDMNLIGGLGDVTVKNILLTPPPTTEKLVGVRHSNGKDYWVITHPLNSNDFNAYLVTSAGINTVPIVSHSGTTEQGALLVSTWGYLKASPNGKKLALAYTYYDYSNPSLSFVNTEIYDFNNSTGVVTNPIIIANSNCSASYGLSFSPDNSKLYASFYSDQPMGGEIVQFDLSNNLPSTIIASRTFIDTTHYLGSAAMQLAPNGKIYITWNDQDNDCFNQLGVINNPNDSGIGCNFQKNGSFVNGCALGLPNFIEGGINNLYDNFKYSKSFCIGGNITISPPDSNLSNYMWSTGDTTIKITVNNIGKYWVTFRDTNDCLEADTFIVHVSNYPIVKLGNDTAFCIGEKKLNAYNPTSFYYWSTGETSSNITVTKPDTYWVEVNKDGCISRDTLTIYPDLGKLIFSYPNIITLNGDDVNDYIVFGNKLFSSFHLEIYNRWGKLIYESDDTMCFWWPEEQTITEGTYYYIAQYRIDCSSIIESKVLKGFITVIR